MVYDLILCGILIAAFLIGFHRGLLRSIWGISALIIAIVLTSIFHPYVVEFFKGSIIADSLTEYVHTTVSEKIALPEFDSIYTLPQTLMENSQLNPANIVEDRIGAVTDSIINNVINIASAILLFIFIRLALAIVYTLLKLVFTLPVLRQTNRLAGGVAQTVIALVFVYAILAVIAVSGTDILNDSVVCKLMYDHNILLTILSST